jgi:hypothetical protein
MAIQNFLAGGFYGKLGDVVGQRWRNKRTLRRYVIGANPQTPAQQANRQQFADAVSLAQEAMNINKGSPAWNKPEMSEFSFRTGTARRRIKNAVPSGQIIPIIPDDYETFLTLTNLSLEQEAGGLPSAIKSVTSIGNDERQFMFIIYVLDIIGMIYKKVYLPATVAGTDPFNVPLSLPWEYIFTDESFIVGASSDDSTNESKTIFIPNQTLAESGTPSRTIDLSFVSSSFTSAGLEIRFEQNHDFEITADSFYANIILNGALSTLPVTNGALFERINDTQWKCTLSIPAANYWGADSKVLSKAVTEFFDPVNIMLKSAEITASNITPVIFLNLNSFSVEFYYSETPDRLYRSDITLNEARTFKIEIYVYDFNAGEYTTIQMETTVPGNTAFLMPISMDWFQGLTPSSYIKGATIDNVPNVNKTILIPQTTISEPGGIFRYQEFSIVDYDLQSDSLYVLVEVPEGYTGTVPAFYSDVELFDGVSFEVFEDLAVITQYDETRFEISVSFPTGYYWDEDCSISSYGTTVEKPLYSLEYWGETITSAEISPL